MVPLAVHDFDPVEFRNTPHPVFATDFPGFVLIGMNLPVAVYVSAW